MNAMLIHAVLTLLFLHLPSTQTLPKNSPPLSAQTESSKGDWVRDTSCGFPFQTALNVVVRNSPPSFRLVLIYMEPQYITEENFKKLCLCVSAKFLRPELISIQARSDKQSLQRWIDYYSAFHSIKPDGSPEKGRYQPSDLPDDLENEVGFYRASYSRSDFAEHFDFSPNPNLMEMTGGVIKRNLEYIPTGDATIDLVRASQRGMEQEVKRLLNNGADVNGRNIYGNTPLLAAIDFRRWKIVDMLLNKGADVNQQDIDGWSPLMWALCKENGPLAEDLLQKGANVNAVAENRDTALIIATARGMTRLVGELLREGANAIATDRFGRTPLMIAEEHKLVATSSLLKNAVLKK